MLNSDFVDQQSAAFAARLLTATDGTGSSLIQAAFQLALARNPSADEEQLLSEYFARYDAPSGNAADSRRAATELLAKLVLNLNEFIYVD